MKIYLAADHKGFDLKEKIKVFLLEKNYNVIDFGAEVFDNNDDYPDFVKKVGEVISKDVFQGQIENKAIIFGFSGQGEAMSVNRYKGVRATVFYGGPIEIAKKIVLLSREHNNANVLSVGSGFVDEDQAKDMINFWLATPFSKEDRHIRRIQKIDQIV